MIPEEIMMFMLLGTMTSATMAFFVTEGKKLETIILLAFQGLFTGLLAGYFWIILTGGLKIDLFAVTMPVIVSAGISYILLYHMPRSMGHGKVNLNMSRLCSIALVVLVFFIAFSALPMAYKPSINATTFSVNAQDWDATSECNCTPTEAIPISIASAQSSVDVWNLAEKPSVGRYLNFEINFASKGLWAKPYVKMAVYKDTNGNGILDSSDVMWNNANCKVIAGSSYWRGNAVLGTTQNILTLNDRMLPIFHAGKVTSQNGVMNWQGTTLRDNVITYASIDDGETTALDGTLYCGVESVGKNLLVVKTYDADTSDPYSNTYPAMQEKVIPFEVTAQAQPATIYGIPLNGGLILAIGIIGMLVVIYIVRGGKKWI